MSVKYIIGVDLSLRHTGIVVHDNTGKFIAHYTIKTTAGWPDHKSCDYIVEQFFELLEDYMTEELCRTNGTVFFFEDFYYASGGRAGAGKLAGRLITFGVIVYLLRMSRIRAYAVVNSSLTSFLLGKAPRNTKEKKKAVMDWLHLHRNYYTANDNLADAYMCAEFGYAVIIEGQKLSYRTLFVR